MTFLELAQRAGTDKVTRHNYQLVYPLLLAPYRDRPIKLLEIGIAGGASMRLWREYLPQAQLFGLDISKEAVLNAPEGVTRWVGDQNDVTMLTQLGRSCGPFDVVIDDGSHRVDHQQTSCRTLWPFVSVGGTYVIEDLETSKSRREKWGHHPGFMPTLDWLLQFSREGVQRNPRPPMFPTLVFCGELCALVKNSEEWKP